MGFRVAKTSDDVLSLSTLVKEALEESRYNQASFSPRKAQKFAEGVVKSKRNQIVLVAEKQGEPIGFLYCIAGELLVADNYRIGTVQTIYVSAAVRNSLLGGRVAIGLLKGAASWAKSLCCKELNLHLTYGIEAGRASTFALRVGFSAVGPNFSKVL